MFIKLFTCFLLCFGIVYGMKDCIYNNANYTTGASFPSSDGCNACFCNNGAVACTMKFCPPTSSLPCRYNNHVYHEGDSFKSQDGCNTCGCSNGAVFCTLMACSDPIVPPN